MHNYLQALCACNLSIKLVCCRSIFYLSQLIKILVNLLSKHLQLCYQKYQKLLIKYCSICGLYVFYIKKRKRKIFLRQGQRTSNKNHAYQSSWTTHIYVINVRFLYSQNNNICYMCVHLSKTWKCLLLLILLKMNRKTQPLG